MSTNLESDLTSNELISKMIKAKPKSKKSLEHQDSESLNTMEYYKEDSSNKNSLIEDLKEANKLLYNPNKTEETLIVENSNKNNIQNQMNKTNKDRYTNTNITRRKNSINISKTQNTLNAFHNICSNCYADIGVSNNICIKCQKYYCNKCFKGNKRGYLSNIKNRNNINNNNELDLTEKICQFCRNSDDNNFNYYKNKIIEPLDSYSDNEMAMIKETKKITNSNRNNRNKSEGKMKSLKEKLNEYEELLNKINDSKNELEIKKNICFNILQMMKKAIEIEYNKTLNKLNELSMKLIKIKEEINKKINDSNKVYQNEVGLQIIIDTYRNSLNNISKIFDNYNQKLISRSLFRGYKLYETNNILINYSETYFMNYKEILSDVPFGTVYIKIDRYSNSYINFIRFSIIIKPINKTIANEFMNSSFLSEANSKSRFIVNMIVNNRMIRLNKSNKDNNDLNLNYEASEEENKISFPKDKNNSNINKSKVFNVKVIISEVLL